MAVVSISDSNNRAEDMEGTPTVTDIGAGAGGGKETVTYFQGLASISRKITSVALRGTGTTVATPVNMTTGDNTTWMSKTLLTDYLDINSVGWLVRCGSTTADYYDYILLDDGTLGDRSSSDFPRGGWIVEAVNPNVTAWRDASGGTADLTAMDVFQTGAGLATGAAKAENIYIDAIDMGDGLYLVGGDSTDPDGTWADFVADDQGTGTAGRFGHFLTNESGIEVRGKAIRGRTSAGTVTATVFTDSLQSVTWPGGRVDAGWNELEDDLGNASTVITETNTNFVGRGRGNTKRWFDTENEVTGGATDTINITSHGYSTGDAVLYSSEGGTNLGGLTTGTEYFVRADDANTLGVFSTRANAYANTARISLTPAGTGEQHSLRLQPDTRPDYTVSGVSGSATYTGCNFIRFRNMYLTSAVTLDSCNLVNCNSLDLNNGTLDTCVITTPTLAENETFVSTPDLSDIVSCTFTEGEDGHAIELTVSGVHSMNNTLTGYWQHSGDAGKGAEFTTDSGGVDATGNDITTSNAHGFTTGDAVYYNDNGGVASIGLTDGDRYYVNVISTTNFSLHVTKQDATTDTNRVSLSTSGAETHTFYSTKAAILNRSGGLVTINVTGGSTPYVRNYTNSDLATVNVSVPIEITGLTEGSRAVMIGDGGGQDGVILLQGYADSAGEVSGTYSGSTPQLVKVRGRNGGIINAAIMYDEPGSYTDYTNEARDLTGSNDVDLLPASPAINDAFYFGGLAIFGQVLANVTTAGTTYALTWEYYNGSWVALTVTDGTNSFQTTGWNRISFTKPGDWATTTLNGQGPFYYIRARVTSGGGTQPKAESITLNETTKYQPFDGSGTIQSSTGLSASVVWLEDTNNP
jgi:hypothetical protein